MIVELSFYLPYVAVIALLFWLLFLIKDTHTEIQRDKISWAILRHNFDAIYHRRNGECIEQTVKEPYNKTLFRFWDWGYTRIVLPEVFEKIKPYIER